MPQPIRQRLEKVEHKSIERKQARRLQKSRVPWRVPDASDDKQ